MAKGTGWKDTALNAHVMSFVDISFKRSLCYMYVYVYVLLFV